MSYRLFAQMVSTKSLGSFTALAAALAVYGLTGPIA